MKDEKEYRTEDREYKQMTTGKEPEAAADDLSPEENARREAFMDEGSLEEARAFFMSRFDEDELALPADLAWPKIEERLAVIGKEKAQSAKKTRESLGSAGRRKWQRPLVALAACLALVIGLTPFLPERMGSVEEDFLTGEEGLIRFRSYEEVDQKLAEIGASARNFYGDGEVYIEEDMAATGEMANAAEKAGGGPESPAHSDTYVQVAGIDEADIVKTDGKYIYFVSDREDRVVIARAKDGKAEEVSSLRGAEAQNYINEIFVSGDRLITLGDADYEYYEEDAWNDGRQATIVSVYDISDREDPQLLKRYRQSGAMLSSRMMEDRLLLVTNDYVYGEPGRKCYPCIGEDDELWIPLPVEKIRCFPEPARSAFTVVGSIDITAKEGGQQMDARAVLGGSEEIYCSSRALYLSASAYDKQGREKSYILKVDISGEEPEYREMVSVRGHLNDQFSMDDGNGVFKLATTGSHNGTDVNHLFLFDEKMAPLGKLTNFAKNEHIEAVRYIGDKAYVITYEQTDPLFIIDLSDPAEPRIEGHVKISGFSTLLVPRSDDTLLGIGFSTESTEWGEATNGVKLALFDIQDPGKPEVADSLSYPGMSSQVQFDHRGLLVGPEDSYYAIPYEVWQGGGTDVLIDGGDGEEAPYLEQEAEQGVLLFSVEKGKLKEQDRLKTEEPVRRCLYIGEQLYAICSGDEIEGFELK